MLYMNKEIKTTMNVNNNLVSVVNIKGVDYILNEHFKLAEFREFKNDSATQSFTMSHHDG